MATHRYRVTQTLPWIEGGRPGPTLGWFGGTSVGYYKDSTIRVDDREVPGIEHCLEAMDAGGRTVLDRVRRTRDAPATVTPAFVVQPDGTVCVDASPGSLHPNAFVWLKRVTDEQLCQAGRFLDLVLRLVTRGDHPTRGELAAAQREAGNAPPTALQDYVSLRASHPRQPGPRRPRRTTWEVLAIKAHYDRALVTARAARHADSGRSCAVKQIAAAVTARVFTRDVRRTSARTVQRVVESFARRPWVRDDVSG